MDIKQKKEQLKFWKKQEIDLEKRFGELMKLRGEAAQEGDLRENAAYELRTEEAQVASSQLAMAKKKRAELEKELKEIE